MAPKKTATRKSAKTTSSKRRQKAKVSSEDFMRLLDQQEANKEKVAFKPKSQKPKAFQLTPMQKELVDLALKYSPRFVKRVVEAPRTQMIFSEVLKRLDGLRIGRSN